MQWRVVTAVLLLAAIFLGGLAARSWVDRLCQDTAQPLEALWDQLQSGQWDPDLLSLARERWERSLPILSSLVAHDRLEQVSCQLAQAEGFLMLGELEECSAQLNEIQYLLGAIQEYDHITLQSVF